MVLPGYLRDIRALATWNFVKVDASGNPVLEPITVLPSYPQKKMRLDALRKAATVYNTVARVRMYNRMKKAEWHAKYISGQFPDLFMRIYHDIMEANGSVPEAESVQAEIAKLAEERRAVPPAILQPEGSAKENTEHSE